jgi:valyl-tRNA synthetase
MRREGASVDWSREKFTMDEDLSRVVREVFVRLLRRRLIYRGDPHRELVPARSDRALDLEVEKLPQAGKLYYLQYPIKDSDARADSSHNPSRDNARRYCRRRLTQTTNAIANLVGQTILLPLTNREIPLIADEYVDPEFRHGRL